MLNPRTMTKRLRAAAPTAAPAAATPAPTSPPALEDLVLTAPDLVDRIFDYVVQLVPEISTRKTEIKGALRGEFGAQESYIRRRERSAEETAQQVLAMFNGRNKHEVARTLDISLASVHRILKQSGDNTEARRKLSQPPLDLRRDEG